jgi:DNA-3-methyladenine glycosylase I
VTSDGIVVGEDGVPRCWWGAGTPEYVSYHDEEWGRPIADEALLFEKLSLEGFQSGLSWLTILRKREAFRRAFDGFRPDRVAAFGESDVERLLRDAGIVRHRGKIEATIGNARRALEIREEAGSLAAYVWGFAPDRGPPGEPLTRVVLLERTTSPEAEAMARDLKRRGWRFVGPTTVYSFMQAVGLVNDHLTGCAAHAEVETARGHFGLPGREAR